MSWILASFFLHYNCYLHLNEISHFLIAALPCDTTPCVNGVCTNVNNDTDYSCDCTNTGFDGRDCDVGKKECIPKYRSH